MASQVLSGASDFTYTNNTGQNVRVVINFMQRLGGTSSLTIRWAGVSVSATLFAIGRNLSYFSANEGLTPTGSTQVGYTYATAGNAFGAFPLSGRGVGAVGGLPTEIMLAPGQTFSATGCNAYNIVVIPEEG